MNERSKKEIIYQYILKKNRISNTHSTSKTTEQTHNTKKKTSQTTSIHSLY